MAVDVTALAIKVTSEGIREASQALGGLSTSAGNATKRVDTLVAAMKRLDTASLTTAQASNAFMDKLRQQAAILAGMDNSLRGASAGAAGLAASLANLAAVVVTLNTQLAANTARHRQNNAAMAEAHALARGLSGSLGALWVTYGNLAGMAVGIAIGASLKGVVSVGKDVEHTLEQIRVLGGASTQEIAQMSAVVNDLGKGSQGPRDVAEALSVLTLAGLNAKEAMTGVGAALNLAVAGSVSIEKSAETLVQVSTSLGYTADGFDHVADVITKAAAASMSSVESISGAFRSASSVGEVYGATLNDIAVGLAAIANLGIQGTAAGTALKNFYKDLTSTAEKTVKTLKDMGLAVEDFRGKEGFVLPIVELIERLDSGLSTLKEGARNDALGNLFGERGIKEAAALVKMLHTASEAIDEVTGKVYKSRLHEISAEIQKSAGFATTAAIAMGQTTTNQLKSVANTLETVFADAFKSVQPQIGEVARALKSAFNSKEFQDGLRTIITLVADLTKMLVDNLNIIVAVAKAYAAFKVLEFATGLAKVALAFDVASIAAKGFTAALGPLGLAIVTITTLWTVYKLTKDDALDNKAGSGTLQEYADQLVKAAEKEKKALEMRKAGYSDMDIARKQQIESDKEASAAAVKASQKGLDSMKKQLDDMKSGMSIAERTALVNPKLSMGETSDVVKYRERLAAYNRELVTHANLVKVVAAATDTLTASRKENGELADKAAQDSRIKPTGEGELTGKVDKAKINDAYAAELAKMDNLIKEAKDRIESGERTLTNAVKAGSMGRLDAIKQGVSSQVAEYHKIGEAIQEQIQIATNAGKQADVARFTGDKLANVRAENDARKKAAEETSVYLREIEMENTRTSIKAAEDKGEYVKAAQMRWESDYKAMYLSMKQDAEKYGDVFPQIQKAVENLEKAQRSMMASAQVREAAKEFDVLFMNISNGIKAVENDSLGSGLTNSFKLASEAAREFEEKLPRLNAELVKLWYAAEASGSSDDMKKYEDAVAKKTKLVKDFGKMWGDTANNIGKSLEVAFGKSGKVAGNMLKTIVDYNNQDNQSMQAKLSLYGNLAGQAAQYFDKQSTGYKVMTGISKAFYLAEMAMAIASIGPKLAAGAATMFAQSGWGGFAGVAAMLGVMAALGYAGSRGGSGMSAQQRQEQQGTGSVLGDPKAKSDSIEKALDTIAKNSGLGLAHSANAEKYLKNISDNISNLASLIVRTTGLTGSSAAGVAEGRKVNDSMIFGLGPLAGVVDQIPVIGKLVSKLFGTTTKLVDQGIQIASASLAQIQQAGVNAQAYATVNTKKSFFGISYSNKTSDQLSGLDPQIGQQFGLLIDNMAKTIEEAAKSIGIGGDEFTKKLQSFVVDIGKISFKDMKADEIEKTLQAVFSKLGDDMANFAVEGLSQFQKVGEGALQTLARIANEYVQVSDVMAVLGKTFNVTGMAAVQMSQDLIKAAGSIEKLTEGTKFFVDNFLSAEQKLVPIQKSVDAELARLGITGMKTKEQFAQLVLAQDLNTKAGQDMYTALLNLAPAFQSVIDLTEEVAEEVKRAAEEALQPVKDAANAAYDALIKAIDKEQQAVQDAYDAQIAKIKEMRDAASEAYNAQKDSLQAAISAEKDRNSALNALQSALRNTLDTMIPKVTDAGKSFKQAMADIDKALAAAKKGKFTDAESLSGALKAIQNPDESKFGNYVDFMTQQGIAAGKLADLEAITGKAKTVSDKQLDALESSLKLAEAQYKAMVNNFEEQEKAAKAALDLENKRFETMRDYAQKQLDAVNNGVVPAIQSVVTALSAFNTAIGSAISAINAAKPATGGTGAVNPPANQASDPDAWLKGLYKTILGRDADAEGMAYWKGVIAKGESMTSIVDNFYNSDEYKSMHPDGSHASGLDEVPRDDYIARLHKGEMVVPAAKAEAMRNGDETQKIVDAINKLREDNTAQNDVIIDLDRKVWKLLDRVSPGQDAIQVRTVT